MKTLLAILVLSLSLSVAAESISPKDLSVECGSTSIEAGFFRTTKNKKDYLATVDKGHPMLVGEPVGKAEVKKLRPDTYQIIAETMIIVPWTFTEYWDVLTLTFNTKSKKLSYKLVVGYDGATLVEDSKTCQNLFLGEELEAAIKKL